MSRNPIISAILSSPCAHLNEHLKEESGKISRVGKYGNVKTVDEGEKFDSVKEMKRYKDLKLLLKAGKIGHLKRQVDYELNAAGTHSLIYRADFVYIDAETGKTIVEDVKGFLTRDYKKKRRLMKKVLGITILET